MNCDVRSIVADAIAFRHELHQVPEIAGKEVRTSALIRKRLEAMGLTPVKPLLGTDVVVLIQGGKGPGKNVSLRADMDALAIQEETGLPFASRNPGMMHACGHDGHAAMLMGAAQMLLARRSEFSGSVRLIWQPGEENLCMGKDLVAAGVLENPHADLVTTLHIAPGFPVGTLGFIVGPSEAANLHFTVRIKGRGGHSSRPDRCCDPVLAAASAVMELQNIVSRRVSPFDKAVLSVCTIHSGTLSNVIPDTAEFSGTARALSADVEELFRKAIPEVCASAAACHGCTAETEFFSCYALTVNSEEASEVARKVIEKNFPPEVFLLRKEPSMGADDFGFYTREHSGVYVKLGAGESGGLHTCGFTFPDEAMENGIRFFTEFAIAGLQA